MKIKFFSVVNGLDSKYDNLKNNFLKSLSLLEMDINHEIIELNTIGGDFHKGDFDKTVYKKLELTRKYLLNGYHVLCADLDIVFLKNPIDYLINKIEKSNCDILFQHDYIAANKEDNNPGKIYSQFCTGFFFAKPSRLTIQLFNHKYGFIFNRNNKVDLTNACDIYDQGYINTKLKQKRFSSMKILFLNRNLFPNGWYWENYHCFIDPYIIHYNCILGIEKKENEMKKFNHWFL